MQSRCRPAGSVHGDLHLRMVVRCKVEDSTSWSSVVELLSGGHTGAGGVWSMVTPTSAGLGWEQVWRFTGAAVSKAVV